MPVIFGALLSVLVVLRRANCVRGMVFAGPTEALSPRLHSVMHAAGIVVAAFCGGYAGMSDNEDYFLQYDNDKTRFGHVITDDYAAKAIPLKPAAQKVLQQIQNYLRTK